MKIKNTSIGVVHGNLSDYVGDAVIGPIPFGGKKNEEVSVITGSQEKDFGIKKVQFLDVGVGNAYFINQPKGNMPFRIDVVVEDQNKKITQESVRNAFAQALLISHQLQLKSILITSLINDAGKMPIVGEAKILIQEVLKFLKTKKTFLEKIVFCLETPQTHTIFKNTISGYITHLQDTLGEGPYVTVDIIIELKQGIILIERSNPPYGWALPGGFVDYGESLETAAAREAKEETNMELEELKQFHAYSDPSRDPRFHTVSTVFIAQGKGTPAFGDDAKGLKIVAYDELLCLEYAFDHKKIIEDYIKERKP